MSAAELARVRHRFGAWTIRPEGQEFVARRWHDDTNDEVVRGSSLADLEVRLASKKARPGWTVESRGEGSLPPWSP